jgi:hypothetical protein
MDQIQVWRMLERMASNTVWNMGSVSRPVLVL